MTFREINSFIAVLPYKQIDEQAWDIHLHGGKYTEYREKALANLEYTEEDEEFDAEVKKFTDTLKRR